MTALDDALNTASPVYSTPDITADWLEDPPNEASNPNADAMRVLGNQSTGVYQVSQSLDDALPDPVTMTGGNDASTKATIGLNGRDAIFGQNIGWRTNLASGTGTGTSVAVTLPTDSDWGDYSIVAVVLNSNTVGITEPNSADPNGWQVLASFSDGATIKTWIYGRRWYSGAPALTFTLNSSVAWAWVAVSAYARMANGIQVPLALDTPVSTAESVSGTAHSALSATLSRPGFIVGVWSSVGVTWTAGAGSTELNEASSTMDVMVSSTPYQPAGSQVLTATSASATAIATMMAIPLGVVDRRRMSAREFFSPFNRSSPIYGRDRDTALTRIDFNVLGAAGPIATTIHRGQMADISLSGGTADMTAVSKIRLDLDRSLVLPEVWGQREGMAPDWIATWIMARGGQFVGPAPTPYTIWWDPMYGSLRAFLDADSYILTEGPSFYYRKSFDSTGLLPLPAAPTLRPSFVPGPFLLGAFACQDATHVEAVACELYPTTERLPFLSGPAQINDQFSQTNSKGRISFWMRGDAVVSAPDYLVNTGNSGDDFIFRYELSLYNQAHTGWLGYVNLVCLSSTRQWQVQMGSTATGFQTVIYASSGTLPTDGAWHFVSMAWDCATGQAKVRMDGAEAGSNYWGVNIPLPVSSWPVHDADRIASGTSNSDPINNFLQSHLPISDVQIEAGQPYTDDFSVHYPTPAAPSRTATMRPTGLLNMQGLAEVTPITGWNTLAELGQATLSAYRADELDNFNFLPLTYFGEAAQMTSSEVVDTEVNASDMDVTLDPTKTRNVVTVEFQEVSVSNPATPVLSLNQAIEIPRGITFVTFTLDTPCTEIYGKSLPGDDSGGNWTFWNLIASQISPGPQTSIGHYMSVNTKQDGSGSVVDWNQVKARIMSATSSTVTIRFTNLLLANAWLANNGDNVPVLLVRGNSLTTADGYVTIRDAGSVGDRRERSLNVQIPWIDNRTDATIIANWLVTMLARPRPELKVTAVGDPRRKPGQLVTIADGTGTQADGLWRILSVDHNAANASFTQDLALVYQLPIGLWDDLLGWDNEAWGV